MALARMAAWPHGRMAAWPQPPRVSKKNWLKLTPKPPIVASLILLTRVAVWALNVEDGPIIGAGAPPPRRVPKPIHALTTCQHVALFGGKVAIRTAVGVLQIGDGAGLHRVEAIGGVREMILCIVPSYICPH
jgi:hypothetical protein